MNRTIINGSFPTYPLVETIDLSIVLGWPSIPHVLGAILPMLDLAGIPAAWRPNSSQMLNSGNELDIASGSSTQGTPFRIAE